MLDFKLQVSEMNLPPSSSNTSSSLTSLSSSLSSSSSSSTGSWFSGIVRSRSDRSGSIKTNTVVAKAGDSSGPVVSKNQFRGVMFKYGPKPIQVCRFFPLLSFRLQFSLNFSRFFIIRSQFFIVIKKR